MSGSVRGAAHVRANLPNQDAVGWQPTDRHGARLVIAVADGHGSASSFRSQIGSRLGVEVAVDVLWRFVGGPPCTIESVRNFMKEEAPRQIVETWCHRVMDDRETKPITKEELDLLRSTGGGRAITRVTENPRLVYGTTLLAVVITDQYFAYLQLGDGDIIAVSPERDVTRPLPPDARLFANETLSLCGGEAQRDFRVTVEPSGGSPPSLILLSTDGYANSFKDEASFKRVGPDILDAIAADGLVAVESDLGGWLTETSQLGSGDDITLALVHRTSTEDAQRAAAVPAHRSEGAKQSGASVSPEGERA